MEEHETMEDWLVTVDELLSNIFLLKQSNSFGNVYCVDQALSLIHI